MLHLRHAAMQGHTKAYVRTVDSDVVVFTISIFHELGLSELIRNREIIQRFSNPSHLAIAGTLTLQSATRLPCHHRVRRSISDVWNRQVDGMKCMDSLSRGHRHTDRHYPGSEQLHT